VHVCVHTRTCMYVYIYMYVHVHIIYVLTCLRTYIPTYLRTYVPARLRTYIHTSAPRFPTGALQIEFLSTPLSEYVFLDRLVTAYLYTKKAVLQDRQTHKHCIDFENKSFGINAFVLTYLHTYNGAKGDMRTTCNVQRTTYDVRRTTCNVQHRTYVRVRR